MPSSTHQELVNVPRTHLTGLPTPPGDDADDRDSRQNKTIQGHSHHLYTNDIEMAYPTSVSPGTTYIHAMANDGSTSEPNQSYPRLQINDPIDAKRLLKTNLQKPSFPYKAVLVGRGLIGQDDTDAWRHQRAWIKPAFQARHVIRLLPLVISDTEKMISDLHQCVASSRDQIIHVHELLLETTFVMIGHLMLGERSAWLKENGHRLRQAFSKGLQPYFRMTSEGQEAEKTMRAFTQSAIERYRDKTLSAASSNTSARLTLLSRLLDPDSASPYSQDDELRHDELMTTMFAGHETTANTLAWCLYELSRHKEQQEIVRAAIVSHAKCLGRSPSEWTFREFNKVTIVTHALRETMRLWPVVANGPFRELRTSTTVKGRIVSNHDGADESFAYSKCDLPAPTAFQVPHWTLHRNPALWGSSSTLAPPDTFDIRRPASEGWNSEAYMPFSRPPRDCLGRHIATMEMQVLLTMILYSFELSWPSDQPAKQGHNWATLEPEGGLSLHMRPISFPEYTSKL